ncbi:PIR protein [Plasmodium yoelii]|uniref:PIR protein n=2 Tax=Plasmodium yoelii TaxID=5861 RepID=A0AAF0B1I0_PLAYO|nr:PIR protein [Plasmodium yoelii]WBY56488.1 PIR protein [Plasmodium yoelii yoelii]CDU17357.1 YIR protein [Plasmodium yoelii]VTZ76650.1 PIR protein [Plasmodium yoelii]|eukprot:XP_022811867.1 PIR protein [Plasmodium yoelii]
MDKEVCRILISISNSFPNSLDKSGNYHFTMNEDILNGYCTNKKCSNNFEKINAGCLYLLDAFFENPSVFNSVAKSNVNIVEYIMIWLSKMLSRIENTENESLGFFYNTYIKGDNNYKKSISNVMGCNNYKELIDKTNMMNMKIKDISKLYDAFNTLCMMHYEFNEKSPNCDKYLKDANKFVEKYKKLKADSSITEKSSYNQLLSTLLTDYNNFENKCISNGVNCTNFPSLQTIEKKHHVQSFEQISEDTSSSSSVTNKLFTVLSIFGVIAFILGISYKYSLFGFRKRFQKQKLREKLKNIKKRMNQ